MQSDLFEIPIPSLSSQAAPKLAFLERFRFSLRLDQALVGTIALIMIYVLVFSFGVEKGKRFALAELKAERLKRETMVEELGRKLMEKAFPGESAAGVKASNPSNKAAAAARQGMLPAVSSVPTVPQADAVKKTAKGKPLVKEKAGAITQVLAKPAEKMKGIPQGKYTIQIVTYTNKKKAAAQTLLKEILEKGLKGFVMPTGSNLVVCVDAFEDQIAAKKMLVELKAQKMVPTDAYIRVLPQSAGV